jgi:cytidylate kinase
MSIIVLLSDSLHHSRELAQQIASLAGYARHTQEDILEAVAAKTNRSLQDFAKCLQPVSFPWHKMLFRQRNRDRLLLEEELAELICQNDFTYEGVLGFPLFQNISHALRVRLIGGDQPAKGETEAASQQITRQVRKWAADIYGINLDDPSLFDLTLNMDHMTIMECAELLQATLQQQRFKAMTYSLQTTVNVALSCRVRRTVADRIPDAQVRSHNGTVYLFARAIRKNRSNLAMEIKNTVQHLDGVRHVEVYGEKKAFDAASCGQ